MIRLELPYPVSGNKYWRASRGRNGAINMHRSKEADKYRETIWKIAKYHRVEPEHGNFKVDIRVHPRMNKDGSASQVRQDLDNTLKITLDALQGVFYHDDKQVVEINARYGEPMQGGGLTVIAEIINEEK